MPFLSLVLAATTASGAALDGGGSLFGARFPGPDEHPGAVIWQPRYWMVSRLTRRLSHPDVAWATHASDPGRGPLGAAMGVRYRYEGTERHFVGGSASLGLRLGGGLGLGLSGAYQPDSSLWDTIGWGVSYAAWPRSTLDGNQPGLILGVDHGSGIQGDGAWRASASLRPLPDLLLGWDHRFDGRNQWAMRWRFGPAEFMGDMAIDALYDLGPWGLGARWHDRGGWIGLAWQRAGEAHILGVDLAVPIGQNTKSSPAN